MSYLLKQNRLANLSSYIIKVQKQHHPDLDITTRARESVNMISLYLIEQIANHIKLIMKLGGKKKTVTLREVQTAVRLFLPGELAKRAIFEATRTVTIYNENVGLRAGHRAKPQSKSARAGLTFPVTRIGKLLSYYLGSGYRKGVGASVYLAAVVEDLVGEILGLAGKITKDLKIKRITQRSIKLSILRNEELDTTLAGHRPTVLGGGVYPYIPRFVLESQEKKGRRSVSD